MTVNTNLDDNGGGAVEMGTSGNLLPGTTILGGTNSYSGGTSVPAGCLIFATAMPCRPREAFRSAAVVMWPRVRRIGGDFLGRITKSTATGVVGFEGGVSGAVNLTGFNDSIRLGAGPARRRR